MSSGDRDQAEVAAPGEEDEFLSLHAILPRSRANGPGWRAVVWFQGCSLECPGCFNPETHPFVPRLRLPVRSLLESLAAESGALEGITLSGGEPLEQRGALLRLLEGVRALGSLSVILFSGYTRGEISADPVGLRILDRIDVLIDGRFEAARRLGRGLRGSTNQHIHLLSGRYRLQEIETVPRAEIIVDAAGRVVSSGVAPFLLHGHRPQSP